ncbi:MAG: hypothetical protein MI923_27325, partial [Phycisphaerales bacterium]|nr:hypothetical protein [Phycisphaerales bacterium]
TIWANVLMVAGVVLESTGVTDVLNTETQEMALAAILGVVNLVLRFVTREPISISSSAGNA